MKWPAIYQYPEYKAYKTKTHHIKGVIIIYLGEFEGRRVTFFFCGRGVVYFSL